MAAVGSFDDFFRLQQAGLVRYAALLTGSAAQGEDLVQDVLIRLYLRWDELTVADGNVLAYARRAVTNEHISWRRRWSTRTIHSVGDQLPDIAANDRVWSDNDEVLLRRLHQLPARQRAALVMRYYQELTDAEIAGTLGCRAVTVRAYISRGLRALRVDYLPDPAVDVADPAVDPADKEFHDERH